MPDLTQENYELRQKLELAQAMERTYLEEIESLRESVRTLQVEQSETITRPDPSSQTCRAEYEERLEHAAEQLASLTVELRSSKEREAQLCEKLSVAECRLEAISSEASLSTMEPNQPDPVVLLEEIARLNEELDTLKTDHRIERSKLERNLAELEEEKVSLQSDVCELNRHLKESRDELSDVRAQLEAIELQQAYEASNTRGNSAFSELEDRRIRAEELLEDRRIRAEELVKKQRNVIDDLRAQLVSVQAESNKKLDHHYSSTLSAMPPFCDDTSGYFSLSLKEEELRKLETRFRERDTQFTDNLVAERRRLMDENRTLQIQLQQFEELQVDNERRASTVSKAFNLRDSGQESLVNALERRIALLQRRLTEKTTLVDGLRDRMLKAHYMRRQIQTELWNQMDITNRLSEQLQKSQKQWLAQRAPLEPVSQSNEREALDVSSEGKSKGDILVQTATNLRDELSHQGRPDTENAGPSVWPSDTLISEPQDKDPQPQTKQSKTNVVHLGNLRNTQTKDTDTPPDCKPS
ncbi:hypothetical protein T265_09215 [Opisthorchis viverrini]|uniref:Uncharacterized protein n=1 Tax=Opisthorchis viverrini TaxID=6198 RepID=A0A074ZB40_OPIVI|nr:hypothetical protein T265_09215 [Opisthorchis viverrini]KER22772.1 hypothetical protein T265_09215 [Opisthorchis viverrini]